MLNPTFGEFRLNRRKPPMEAQPTKCKCGGTPVGPAWTPRAQGYVVRCGYSSCHALAQAADKAGATARWNDSATKI